MLIFGGFNGEYYNDLYYINVFELKTRLQVPSSPVHKNLINIINENKFSDLCISTEDGQLFYLHKGLLINGLKDEQNISKFVEKIDGKFEKSYLE